MVIGRVLTTAAVSVSLALGGGAAAFAGTGGTTSTTLSNGTLYFEAQNGSVVSGNSSVFYGATKYKKTGGSKVTATLKMSTEQAAFSSPQKSASAGQTISHSFGAKSIARYAPDCDAVGLMVASTGQYYTPHVSFC
ncbi:hypothetical protein [Streptomyces sp. NPDC056628]|uniref:hypothetical protein n=1 Tax=Streptomyces sp. NPDC056628 TaxID=3345882 RepID=UPI003678FF6E